MDRPYGLQPLRLDDIISDLIILDWSFGCFQSQWSTFGAGVSTAVFLEPCWEGWKVQIHRFNHPPVKSSAGTSVLNAQIQNLGRSTGMKT